MSIEKVCVYRLHKLYLGEGYQLHKREVSGDHLQILLSEGWCRNERAARYSEVVRLTEEYSKQTASVRDAELAEEG